MGSRRITETVNKNSLTIDEMSSIDIVTLMLEEDKTIYNGIKNTLPDVAKAIDLIVKQWKKGGRVFVVGAGTSGRLGVLDAVELDPTFSIGEDQWIGLVAGGQDAMWKALEQHEDDNTNVIDELKIYDFNQTDVVIGITASGLTPYVIAAIKYANQIGSHAIAISNNHQTLASELSDCGIEAVVGPEVIRGSTRLKAGTAQKMIINMISTGTMVRLGKVYKNQMIDMQLINRKLVNRAVQSLMELVNVTETEAKALLKASNNDLKTAIFLSMTQTNMEQAQSFLKQENGHLKHAIESYFRANN